MANCAGIVHIASNIVDYLYYRQLIENTTVHLAINIVWGITVEHSEFMLGVTAVSNVWGITVEHSEFMLGVTAVSNVWSITVEHSEFMLGVTGVSNVWGHYCGA